VNGSLSKPIVAAAVGSAETAAAYSAQDVAGGSHVAASSLGSRLAGISAAVGVAETRNATAGALRLRASLTSRRSLRRTTGFVAAGVQAGLVEAARGQNHDLGGANVSAFGRSFRLPARALNPPRPGHRY
jgi:hypothetical protein